MNALGIIIAVVIFALVFIPVYLPFAVSFALRAERWREVRWSLRAASLFSFALTLAAPRRRQDFGDDVGGNIAGAMHNFPRYLAWVWGTGLLCTIVGLIIGFYLRSRCGKLVQPEPDESSIV